MRTVAFLTAVVPLLISGRAYGLGEYDPINYDLTGEWTLIGAVTAETRAPFNPTNREWNIDSIGYTTFSLIWKDSYLEDRDRILVTVYRGRLEHRRGLIDRIPLGGGMFESRACDNERQTWEIEAELRHPIDPSDYETLPTRLNLRSLNLIRGSAALSFPFTQTVTGNFWGDLRGDKILISGPPTMLRAIPPGHPSDCGWASKDFNGGLRSVFLRTPAAFVLPKTKIDGAVWLTNPDGTRSDILVNRGSVKLYAQDYFVYPRAEDESSEAYQARLLTARKDRELVATFDLSKNAVEREGQFEFPEVPLVKPREGGYRRVFYTLEVDEGLVEIELEENGMPTGEYIRTFIRSDVSDRDRGLAQNFSGLNMSNLEIWAAGLDEIGAKKALVRRISELGPNHWQPIESRVDSHLERLLVKVAAGTITDEELEGVRRAVIAERVFLSAVQFGRALVEAIWTGLGNSISAALENFFDSSSKDAKAAQDKLNDAGADRWKNYGDNPRGDYLDNETRKLIRGPALVKTIKRSVKRMFDSVSAQAKTDKERLAIKYAWNTLETLFDALVTGDRKEGYKAVVEALFADYIANEAWDHPTGFGYTAYLADDLTTSRERMEGWNAFNEARFITNRAEAYAEIENANTYLSYLSLGSDVASLMADEYYGKAGETFEFLFTLTRIPIFASVEKGAKLAQLTAHIAATTNAIINAYLVLPRLMRNGMDRAYGINMVQSGSLGAAAPPGGEALAQLEAASITLDAQLEALKVALESTDPEALVDAAVPLVDEGLAREPFAEATDCLVSLASSRSNADEAFTLRLAEAVPAASTFSDQLDELVNHVRRLLMAMRSGDLAGPRDPVYLAHRRALQQESENARLALEELLTGHLLPIWDATAAGAVFPTVFSSLELVGTDGALPVATSSDDVFEARARVTNLSSVPVSVDLSLDVTGRLASDDSVQTATLAAGASIELSWTLTIDGEITDFHNAVIKVTIGEDGGEADTFIAQSRSVVLPVGLAVHDSDLDGLPNEWEARHGLDDTDDSMVDTDGDGLSNLREFRLGTNPTMADTDGDGLTDLEEVGAGADGWVTDPRVPDSDGDDVSDSQDVSPLDETDTATGSDVREPRLSIGVTEIRLESARRSASVEIENTGEGQLRWRAFSSDEVLVRTSGDRAVDAESPLFISTGLSEEELAALPETEVMVMVSDSGGTDRDHHMIRVIVGDVDPTDLGPGPGPGPGPGEEDPPGGTESCACSSASHSRTGWPFGVFAALLLILRRRILQPLASPTTGRSAGPS